MASGGVIERRFDTYRFLRAFVSALVTQDRDAIFPKMERDRAGFSRVLRMIDNKIAASQSDLFERRFRSQLIKIKNSLAMSNNGSFDSFEAALRDLQLTFTSCPNHEYDEIKLEVSRPFAEAELGTLSASELGLVKEAASTFLSS